MNYSTAIQFQNTEQKSITAFARLLSGFIILLFSVTISLNAQVQEPEFTEYTVIDGVRLGKINSITQDQNGFLWMSDQGNRAVLRYDGKHIKKFQYDANNPENPENLGGYYPECFYIEESGDIWIGFYGQGLDLYDPETNTFTHYKHDSSNPESLSSNFVTGIVPQSETKLWIATYAGLDLFDTETGVFTHRRYKADDPNSLSCDTVRYLYKDKEGTLWVGTGMAWADDDRGGLNRYNPEKDDFTRFMHDPSDPSTLINNKVRAIFEDSRGTFWVGTGGDGLHTMDRKAGAFTRHKYDALNPEKLSRPPLGNIDDRITFIREDAVGCIWIGTDGNGMNRYDPRTGKTVHYTGPFANGAWWMYVAPDDLLWITTNRAQLVRVNLYKQFIPSVDAKRLDIINDASPDFKWTGTDNGLIGTDKSTGKEYVYRYDHADSNSLSSDAVSDILYDTKNRLWVSTWSGLNLTDPETRKVKRFKHDPENPESIIANEITTLFEDQSGNIWIGTGNGLDRFDPDNETFTHFQYDFSESRSLNGFFITDIEQNSDSSLWVGLGGNRGLNKLDKRTGYFDLYLHGLGIHNLYIDSDNVLWVSTGGGLFKYDSVSDNFIHSGISGDPATVFEDASTNLWVSTVEGVYSINPSRDHVSFFEGKIENNEDEFFENAGVAYMKDSLLYLGHWFGYYVFDPLKTTKHTDTTKVFVAEIRGIEQTDTDASWYTYSPEINNIILPQEDNSFSVRFTETDFYENTDDHVYYMLEKYDVEWRKSLPGDWNRYFKLPAGNYTLRVKASSSSGLITENEFFIKVLPPWWLSGRAYFVYGIIFVAGVFGTHRIQKSRTIRKEREKIKDRELEHARKIEQAYEELKATQEQLIQSEKMASLGELTAGIAHEIQNPLNFVNNFAEVSVDLIEDLNEELSLNHREDAKEIASDLKSNLEKITHHGKRASGIVKGMLQHSRSGKGETEATDINALSDEYLRLAFHGLRAKDKSFNADFKTNFDEKLPLANCIPQDIGRVLLNLINNAFYASAERGRRAPENFKPLVEVSTKSLEEKIQISVKDNGSGIPEQVKDKIFQPFFTTKPAGSGTGLGLSLSYDIIKAHGGELIAASVEGEGTEFIIRLPVS